MRSLSGRSVQRAQPQGALAILRAALIWGLQESLSFLLGLEVFFFLYYLYKHASLQAPAIPPRMPPGKSLDVLRRVLQATQDIQACGRLLEPSGSQGRITPHLSPKASMASMQDLQEALRPKRNESNVEELLREWDTLKRVNSQSQNMAPAVLVSEKERMAFERAMDDAEMMALKHAEISGWFFDRRTGCRWSAARVAEICRGNLAEWMAWAFFHCTPDEVPESRWPELVQLVDEGAVWAGVDFPEGYNPHVQAMRLTMDPIPSEHRPMLYYIVTALALPVVTYYNLESLGFRKHKSGTLQYWLRRGRGKSAEPPIVFCHGVGVNLLPYEHFITELLRQVPKGKSIFLVSLPHISMRINEDVPSSAEMVACLRDMLASWEFDSAHFVGHSFGSIVVAWMCKNSKETVKVATFLDPVCFLLIKPDVCYNFMYRRPETPTQLLMHYFVARELFIAHSLSRNFFWYQNLLWPEELVMPTLVMLSGEDSIVPAHSVRRYLTGWLQQQSTDTLRLLWFPNLGHGEMNFGPVGLAAVKRIVAEMMALEAKLQVGRRR
ncbi:CYP704C1 [Symbiodinium sp. CCMP2456]|nr:CYP704C1 [Symbiodinium sp. CCMP2456]